MSGWFPPGVPRLDLIVLVAPFFLAGITMTICILSAGRYLFCRRCYSLALVIARIECLFVPFVTILGVFTFIALSRESVKALFSAALATIPTARRTARRRNNTIAVQQISEERSNLLLSIATVKFCQRDRVSRLRCLRLLTRRCR